jgi:hypothetical protein
MKRTLLLTALLAGTVVSHAVEKPNSIVILADDLGYNDLSCQGATKLKTPGIIVPA